MKNFKRHLKIFAIPFFLIASFSLFIIVSSFSLDKILNKINIEHLPLLSNNSNELLNALSSSNEVIIAVLALLITVAAIIVELAATRYSSRIIDLFIEDKFNLTILTYFIILNIHSLWIYYFAGNSLNIPYSALINTVLLTIGFILVMPYFAYLFQFLKPDNVISKIKENILKNLSQAKSTNIKKRKLKTLKNDISLAIEQISDIALKSIENKDSSIGIKAILTLKEIATNFLEIKDNIIDSFFKIETYEYDQPDYVTLSDKVRTKIYHQHITFENKILKHYALIFSHSVNNIRDFTNMIAMSTRAIGIKAIQIKDINVINLIIKYFNTYLRTSLNHKDIRTAYNLLYQYKLFTIAVLNSEYSNIVANIVTYFKYYGLLFYQQKLGFILETVAHDICDICIEARKANWDNFEDILAIFLTVDQPSEEGLEEDKSLRGVRKAQIKLAVYLLYINDIASTKIIVYDMIEEPLKRIESICNELMRTKEEFWEIIDRGSNFDYIPEEWKNQIPKFIQIFKEFEKSQLKKAIIKKKNNNSNPK